METSVARSLLVSTATLMLAIAPAGAAVHYENQGHSPGIDGFNPKETTISAGNVQNLTLAWQSNTTDINGVYAMVEDNSTIFVESNDSSGAADVVALNAGTGAELWKAFLNATDNVFGTLSGIAVGSGRVFAPCLAGLNDTEGLCAFSEKTGKLVWFDSFYVQGVADGGPFERPTYTGGVVYVSEGMCDLHVPNCDDFWAINAKSGAIIWGAQPSAPEFDFNGYPYSPAVATANGTMYVPCTYAFNGNNDDLFDGLCTFGSAGGTAGWSVGLENDGNTGFAAGVSVSGSTVFFQYSDQNRNDDVLEALGASTGTTLWSFTSAFGYHDLVQPTVAKGAVYWPDANGTLWSLNEKTGTTRWSTGSWGSFCSPVDGTESQPQIVNGAVFITAGCQNGGERYVTTFAVAASNGTVLWQDAEGFNTTPIVTSGAAPMIVSGELYADCVNVCAYTLSVGSARRP